jgi:hypothetical protein
MQRLHRGLVVALVAAVILPLARPVAAHRTTQSRDSDSLLSPYWGAAVSQWQDIIVEYAQRRGLDPDFIGAVIWKESLGRARAVGPAGAIGLMQVMPREEGFSWRPSAIELRDPWRNVDWGTLALSNALRRAHGDLYSALAAYNGGWGQVHLRGPRRYAEDTIQHYARAVAMRNGLSPAGYWVATVAAVNDGAREVLTVWGPQRSLARYSDRPVATRIPDATTYGPPTAVIFSPPDRQGLDSAVGIWILVDGRVVREQEPRQAVSSQPPVQGSAPCASCRGGESPFDRRVGTLSSVQ